MRYVALVDGKVGTYGMVVPDLPGCTSAGSTTDEALRNAVEAARLWAEDAVEDGEALPPPRSIEALRANPEIAKTLAEGAALAIVPLLLDAGRAVRANLSLDAGLDAIDEAAKAHGLTRSAFLVSAAREKIEGREGSRWMPVETPSTRAPRNRHTNKRHAQRGRRYNGLGGRQTSAQKIWTGLEKAGIEFIDENGGDPGVRLRKRQQPKKVK